MGVVAGRVMPIPKGPYDAAAVYNILDMVTLNNKLWIAKQSNFSNQEPVQTNEYWMLAVDGTTDVKVLEQVITEKFTEYDGKFATVEEQLAATLGSVNEALAAMEQKLNTKADMSKVSEVTIQSSGWSGSSAPYSNIVTVEGVTSSKFLEVMLPETATTSDVELFKKADIQKITTNTDSLTFYSYGTKPTSDLKVIVIIRGDI